MPKQKKYSITLAYLYCIPSVSLKKDLPRSCKPRSEPRAYINVLLAHVPEPEKVFIASQGNPETRCGYSNTKVMAARGIV